MSQQTFDLIIVGGGPGGYVAAIRASQLGMTVGLVERAHLGGICLNWGCIPTKALLKSADIYRMATNSKKYGLEIKEISFKLKDIVERSRGVASQLNKGVQHLMKKNKVTVFDGYGRLNGPGKVNVFQEGKIIAGLTAKHIILATGARARILPGMEPDNQVVWTYKEAMTAETMPQSLMVVGSGAIGLELASFYQTFGCQVTVIEVMDRILPVEDEEISKFMQQTLEKQGMKFLTKSTVKSLKKTEKTVTASVETNGKTQEITADRILMAVGVVPNTEDLGLEGTKIQKEKSGHIKVNEWLETDEKGIYAIGDITAGPWLAHKASHEGIICVEKIAGIKDIHPLNRSTIPGCTYTHPQVASVGLTEKAAKEKGYDLRIGRFPFTANGKAIASSAAEGFIKTIFDKKTGELLGAHMVGDEVTELIQGFTIARTLETTEFELMHTIFPHPTLSEMMHEATLDAYDKVIHI